VERWAGRVDSSDLKEADTEALRTIAELALSHDSKVAGSSPIRYEKALVRK